MADWITTREAADMLDSTISWVVKLCNRNILVARKWGREWQVNRASAEAYAQSDRKPGPKPAYQPTKPVNQTVSDQKDAYKAPETREITIRLKAQQIDHLVAKYGNVPDGVSILVDADINRS